MIEISVLGPVEVKRDGHRVPVPGGKTSELLVRLAVDAGTLVPADRLVEDVWAEAAISTRRNTLQSKVAKLRRAFGAPPVLVSRDGGYALAVEAADVDALSVARDSATAAALLAAGDDRGAASLSGAALRRFSGDLLLAAGTGDWALPHRARLDAVRMQLLETQLTARTALGGEGELVGELESAVAAYPYREGLWQLLVTALYRAGRQAEALATYQQVRALLADELGLVPGPRLQELERRILVHDASLGPGHRPEAPLRDDARIGNLPSLSTPLVGRSAETAAVAELVASDRLVTIVGPGGVGKTALAVAAGRQLQQDQAGPPPSVCLARLETAVTEDDVLDAVIAALRAPGGEPALIERLRATAAVVILDNCEHVLDAVATLGVRLLDACPPLRIVCTSQVPLGVDGEVILELAPLSLADAEELFTRRASTRHRGASPAAVRRLCRSLDGLPLAIELAAARTRTLSIAEIGRRLDDRFSVLSDPTSRKPERRRALRATIQWSYELLFPDDQRGLWALAAFAGGAPLPAVESVLEALEVPAATAADVIGRLVSRSLVIVDEREDVRYRLLDSIRAFALEAMDGDDARRALAAHAEWFAQAADASTDGVRSRRQAEFLAFAREERANLDAALAWSAANDPLLALRIASGFGWAWIVLGDSRGAQRILQALEAAGGIAPARDRAGALLLAAWSEASTGRLDVAREHIAQATRLAEAVDDADLRARGNSYLAYVLSHQGAFVEALAATDRAVDLYAGLDRPWDQAATWLFAARAATSAGDLRRARAARDQVERWLGIVEDPWLGVRRDAVLGELARVEHRFGDAVDHLSRAAEASGRLGFAQTEAYQLFILGRAQWQAGEYSSGTATLTLAVEKAQATGDLRLAALARVHLGRVLRAAGDVATARSALEAAATWHTTAGGGEQAALGACLLAALDREDRVPGAETRLAASLEAARHSDDAPVEVLALDGLARGAAERGDAAGARRLRDAADSRMRAASHLISDLDRTDGRALRRVLVPGGPDRPTG